MNNQFHFKLEKCKITVTVKSYMKRLGEDWGNVTWTSKGFWFENNLLHNFHNFCFRITMQIIRVLGFFLTASDELDQKNSFTPSRNPVFMWIFFTCNTDCIIECSFLVCSPQIMKQSKCALWMTFS